MKLAPIAGSLAVNAALLALFAVLAKHGEQAPPIAEPIEISIVDAQPPPVPPTPIATAHAAAAGGTPGHARVRVAPRTDVEATRPWSELATRRDERFGGGGDGGVGDGSGGGRGNGIGLGAGGSLIAAPMLPELPAPRPPSRRRAAKLLHPSRETEVEVAELFVARVTVDEEGDVIGAHMLRSHPGSRGEVADTMIWQFRYAPALDDDGNPVRSTFEQSFAVR